MKSWSVFWRLLLICTAIGLVLGLAIRVAYGGNITPEVVRFRPTLLYWLDAVILWVTASASPKFLERLLLGTKLNFSAERWLTIGRYSALMFVIVGAANIVIYEISSAAWSVFRLAAAPIGLLIVSIVVCHKGPEPASEAS